MCETNLYDSAGKVRLFWLWFNLIMCYLHEMTKANLPEPTSKMLTFLTWLAIFSNDEWYALNEWDNFI